MNYLDGISMSNNDANIKKQNEESVISDSVLSNKLTGLKSRTIDMLDRLTRYLGTK